MDRRRFLQGLGCVIATIPGMLPTLVRDAFAGFVAFEKNTLAGIDCWIPDDFPDRRMSTDQQAKFLIPSRMKWISCA